MYSEDLLKEMQEVPEIAQALEISKESAFTKDELEVYDKYWDMVRVERTLLYDSEQKGVERGIVIGEERGIVIGEERGELKKALETAQKLKAKGNYSNKEIAEITGLSENVVEGL